MATFFATNGFVVGTADVDTLVSDYSQLTNIYPYGIHLNMGGGNHIWDRGPGTVILTYSSIEQFNVTGTNGKDALEGGNYDDIFYGRGGDDYLAGNGGNDTLYGEIGDDTLYGGDGNDNLYGGDGNDILDGGNAGDSLDGGAGDDTLYGGAGDILIDTNGNNQFYANEASLVSGTGTLHMDYRGYDGYIDLHTRSFGLRGFLYERTDPSVFGQPALVFDVGISLDIQGSEHDDSVGDQYAAFSQNDTMYGNGGNDTIHAGAGDDTVYGGTGNDTLIGGNGNDDIYGGDGDDILDGGQGGGTVDGGAGNDTIYSVTGVNGAVKHLTGGAGEDTFMLDVSGDININYDFKFNTQALAQFINDITLPGDTSPDWGRIGKDVAFDAVSVVLGTIPGAGPALGFLAGMGKTGFDLYTDQQALKDQVILQTNKAVEVANSSHYNSLNWGDVTSTTTGIRDMVFIDDFQIGNDIILLPKITIDPDPTKASYSYSTRFAAIPSTGAQGVIISVHQAGGGFAEQTKDIVFIKNNYSNVGISDSEFEATLQNLLINGQIGRFNDTPVIGTTGNDILGLNSDVSFANDMIYAGAGNDKVYGFYGDDVIEGQGGNDIIYGGTDNDVNYAPKYKDIYVSDGNDYISGGDGDDKLYGETGDDYLNGDSTNGLNGAAKVFVGIGNDSLYGGEGNDILEGGNGNDLLNGGTGIDQMRGGTGNDTYNVDNVGDSVDETNGGGIDTVNTGMNYTLGASIENLALFGAGNINGTGNFLNNVIKGNAANNILNGAAGNDSLFGNAGNDTLNGGTGNDVLNGGAGIDNFLFNTALGAGNVDTITGYSVADDTIRLENAIFTSVGAAGALNATMFKAGGIQDANDFILYNTATGALSYDADANGAGAAVQFATLVGVPPLTAADFVVV